ncbi:MAG: hypothetical protein K0Q79_1568 [Flavipsychrobacter sp.]|jgi:hypothetical protein|nr:hypothetical protein [Flavipsychrobacter sp.]
MKRMLQVAFLMCTVVLKPAFAQQTVVYPEAAALRATLYALAAEQKNSFRNIKGALIYTRGTVRYFSGNLHVVPADTPKVCEDTNPMQVYYSDFLARGMSEQRSREVFKKWQELIKSALPGCSMRPDGNQYPDLESLIFNSADGNVNFTLYRNGTGNGCQVSLTFMCKGCSGSAATNGVSNNNTQGNKVQSVDAEGVHIDATEFARQLNQLLAYAKSGFKEIRGAKDKSEYVDKYSTSFKINGAISQELIDFPFLGVSYSSVYMEPVSGTRGNALFEQLRKIVAQSLPSGFVDEGVKDDNRMRFATYSANNQTLFVEINRSNLTKTLTLTVRYKPTY